MPYQDRFGDVHLIQPIDHSLGVVFDSLQAVPPGFSVSGQVQGIDPESGETADLHRPVQVIASGAVDQYQGNSVLVLGMISVII
jgi:hypothetical protein